MTDTIHELDPEEVKALMEEFEEEDLDMEVTASPYAEDEDDEYDDEDEDSEYDDEDEDSDYEDEDEDDEDE